MKTFEIEITETLQIVQKVEANNYDEAFEIINKKYKNEEIILTSEEYIQTDIKPFISSKNYSSNVENESFKNFILKKSEKVLSEMSIEELIILSFGDIENAIHNFKNS
jgi:hypothetical protein